MVDTLESQNIKQNLDDPKVIFENAMNISRTGSQLRMLHQLSRDERLFDLCRRVFDVYFDNIQEFRNLRYERQVASIDFLKLELAKDSDPSLFENSQLAFTEDWYFLMEKYEDLLYQSGLKKEDFDYLRECGFVTLIGTPRGIFEALSFMYLSTIFYHIRDFKRFSVLSRSYLDNLHSQDRYLALSNQFPIEE